MKSLLFAALLPLLALAAHAKNGENWVSLFNGKDLTGWTPKIRGFPAGENHKNTFRAENGVLKVDYSEYERWDEKYGHLFYDKKFSHYRFRLEYRFTGDQLPGGPGWAFRNSGIMLHCESPRTMELNQDFPTSIEVQLLGGNGNDPRATANLCTPGTHVELNGALVTRHCTNSASETFHGDQWVSVEIEVRGNEVIRHFVNGKEVLSYTRPQYDETDAHARKLAADADTKFLAEGFLSLQSESHPVEFRKIEVLVLSE